MSRGSDTGFSVRPARPEDLERALDMFIEVASEGRWIGTELPIDREERLARWRASLEEPRNAFFVAVEGDRIVGNASMRWAGVSDLGMEVAKDRRGRGVGSALLEACIKWARANDVHKIELRVWPHNVAAIGLYEKFGFEREGHLKRHYRRRNGELWDCLIYGLQLT